MKILTAAQVREWDQYTMARLSISSIDLMEKAAQACTAWIADRPYSGQYSPSYFLWQRQ